MNAEEGEIDPHEEVVDIRKQIRNDPPQQFKDADDEENGGKVTDKTGYLFPPPFPPDHRYAHSQQEEGDKLYQESPSLGETGVKEGDEEDDDPQKDDGQSFQRMQATHRRIRL